jgi:hypothetical protein
MVRSSVSEVLVWMEFSLFVFIAVTDAVVSGEVVGSEI